MSRALVTTARTRACWRPAGVRARGHSYHTMCAHFIDVRYGGGGRARLRHPKPTAPVTRGTWEREQTRGGRRAAVVSLDRSAPGWSRRDGESRKCAASPAIGAARDCRPGSVCCPAVDSLKLIIIAPPRADPLVNDSRHPPAIFRALQRMPALSSIIREFRPNHLYCLLIQSPVQAATNSAPAIAARAASQSKGAATGAVRLQKCGTDGGW